MGAAVTAMWPSQLGTVCLNLDFVSGLEASSAVIGHVTQVSEGLSGLYMERFTFAREPLTLLRLGVERGGGDVK